MIRVTVNNRDARATPLTPVTSGAVGLPVHFSFSEDWLQEGLTRIACFHVPEIDTIYSMILDETNETVVPWELLVNHGRVLFIGAYAENAAGTLVIPTIWANAGMIELGTQDGEQGTDPTPSQWTQIRELAEAAADSAAAAESYAEHGPTIINGYWCTWDGEEYVSTGQLAQGPAGQDGEDGEDGVSPAITITPVTGGTSITITDKDHPSGQSFNVLNGQDGADGTDGVSPDVEITPITGGNTITITDKDHPSGQSFSVMDGQDGQDGEAGPPGIAVQASAPTTNVLAWLDTDDDSTVTIPELSDLTAIENTLNSFEEQVAIVVDGNRATMTIALNQLVILKNSTISGKNDGLYRAAQAIPSGTTITASYLSNPITIGGLNEVQRDFWNQIELAAVGITADTTYVSNNKLFGRSFGKVVTINGFLMLTSAAYTGTHTLATIESGKRPIDAIRFPCEVADQAYNPGIIAYGCINTSGEISVNIPTGNTRSALYFSVSYIAQL